MATKVPIHETPEAEIMSGYHLFDGPKATITVGTDSTSKVFILPKALLCYHSTMMNSAFNGEFKEATTLTLSFPENTIEAFNKVVRWIYYGRISIGDTEVDKSCCGSEEGGMELQMAIDFFTLADEMSLLGTETYTTLILKEIRPFLDKVTGNDPYLLGSHIRSAFTRLPSNHAFRILIVQACVKSYLLATQTNPRPIPEPFPFMKELEEIEQFGQQLLKATAEAMNTRLRGIAIDPFTEREFLVNAWVL